jgi:hypothetical protein
VNVLDIVVQAAAALVIIGAFVGLYRLIRDEQDRKWRSRL